MMIALLLVVVVLQASPASSEPQEWERPAIARFMVCEGPYKRGCEHFLAGEDANAVAFFRPRGEKGEAPAQNNLGALYEAGAGVEESREKALRWYQKAASQGLPLARHNLGVLLAADHLRSKAPKPSTRSRDFVEAYVLFALAAEDGLEIAAHAKSDLAEHMSADELERARSRMEEH